MLLNIIENIINSIESIKANKMRSALSMLGIIIGVGSVIILTAIGNGSQQAIVEKIEELGTNILTISPGGFGRIGGKSSSTDFLTEDVVKDMKAIDGIEYAFPTISTNGQLTYGSNNMSSSVLGITSDFLEGRDIEIESGINFTQTNFDELEKVAIIGQDIKDELFGDVSPIGQNLKMGNNVFRVVGVIEENSNYDSYMFIPIDTASIRITGQKYYSSVIVVVEDADNIDANQEDIENLLMDVLGLSADDDQPFNVRNNSEMLENMSSVTQTLTMLLSGIAGISLLVGGIGVMNIMLVSVTERTKEIGIRKAIGAGKKDILLQFLTESGSISVIGGVIGILLSYTVVYILNYFSISAVISVNSIILSFCFSLFIGVVFGLLPAYKAAKLRPIDALRFE